jgi:hypothetical protein
MQTSIITTLLLFLALSSALPQGGANQTCVVPLPIFDTLESPFNMQVRPASTASEPTDASVVQVQSVGAPYHNAYVQFTSIGTPGAYSAWVAPTGFPARVNLTDSRLVLESGPGGLNFTGYLKAPMHTVYRQLGFIVSPSTPLAASAWYGCDENGVQQTVVGPSGGVWCVARDPIADAYGLYVQDPDETGMLPLPPESERGWPARCRRAVQAGGRGGEVLTADGWVGSCVCLRETGLAD